MFVRSSGSERPAHRLSRQASRRLGCREHDQRREARVTAVADLPPQRASSTLPSRSFQSAVNMKGNCRCPAMPPTETPSPGRVSQSSEFASPIRAVQRFRFRQCGTSDRNSLASHWLTRPHGLTNSVCGQHHHASGGNSKRSLYPFEALEAPSTKPVARRDGCARWPSRKRRRRGTPNWRGIGAARDAALPVNIMSGVRTRCMSGLSHPIDMGRGRD